MTDVEDDEADGDAEDATEVYTANDAVDATVDEAEDVRCNGDVICVGDLFH